MDREFIKAYVEQRRRLMEGGAVDFGVVFDDRAVYLGADLREAIREHANEEAAPIFQAIANSQLAFQALGNRILELYRQIADAMRNGDQDLAAQLNVEMDASFGHMERTVLELQGLRDEARAVQQALDAM